MITREEVEKIIGHSRQFTSDYIAEKRSKLEQALRRYDSLKREGLRRESWIEVEKSARKLEHLDDSSFKIAAA